MEFTQLSVLLVVAGVFGIVAKLLKQPLLIGYLFAGILIGFSGYTNNLVFIDVMGRVGVALLLFLLGLELRFSDVVSVGRVSIIAGLGQIIITSFLGYLIATFLGYSNISSVYIAISLTFSSTIIIVKLLSEKKDLSSLYGKISIGLLLVQDFAVIIILMLLSGLGRDGIQSGLLEAGLKAVGLFIFVYLLSRKILPYVFEKIVASSTELLFIVSIAWALGFAAFVAGPLGFSMEIGGFLAGIALSNLPEHLQISARTRPLRDFFLILFFIFLGSQFVLDLGSVNLLFQVILFSVFVLVGNPIIVLVLLGVLGFKKRTSFLTGLTVAQISEFSLILMTMGKSLGHIGDKEISLVLMVGVITMILSTYLVMNSDKLYLKVKKYLKIFERKVTKEQYNANNTPINNHIVLVGCDRTGNTILDYIRKKNFDYMVVDFNPKVVDKLISEGVPVIFGDINDEDVFISINYSEARLLISTIGNFLDNINLLNTIRDLKLSLPTIFTVSSKEEAIKLYEKGASYVVVPEAVAGDHIKHLLKSYGSKTKRLQETGVVHFQRLLSN